MSSKPEFKYDGKDVKWMTVGSPLRVIEVVFDEDSFIRVTFFDTTKILQRNFSWHHGVTWCFNAALQSMTRVLKWCSMS